jgi:hypothetical protein
MNVITSEMILHCVVRKDGVRIDFRVNEDLFLVNICEGNTDNSESIQEKSQIKSFKRTWK